MSVRNAQDQIVDQGLVSIPDVVDAPTIGTATSGLESATVAFTPSITGGAASSYTAISTPGSITGSSATSPITVSGLTGGTSYTFKVYGVNSSGTWSANQSAASNSVTPVIPTAFESIATSTPSGVSTITFSSIPQTYKHLQLRIISKDTSSNSGNSSSTYIRINGDTGSNYTKHYLYGNGTSATAAGYTSATNNGEGIFGGTMPGSAAGVANMFGVSIVDILDYTSTTKNKTARTFSGGETNSGTTNDIVWLTSGVWLSTSAVTSLVLYNQGSNNFASGTTFALYGIKG